MGVSGEASQLQTQRGFNNYLYYFGGFLSVSIVYWAPKPYSNYSGLSYRLIVALTEPFKGALSRNPIKIIKAPTLSSEPVSGLRVFQGPGGSGIEFNKVLGLGGIDILIISIDILRFRSLGTVVSTS